MSSLCNNLLQLQQQPLEPRTYNVKCLCLKWDRVQYIHIINVMVKQQPAATATARLSLSSNLLQHQQQPVAHTHAHTHTHTYTHTHTQLTTAQCSKQLPASKNFRLMKLLQSVTSPVHFSRQTKRGRHKCLPILLRPARSTTTVKMSGSLTASNSRATTWIVCSTPPVCPPPASPLLPLRPSPRGLLVMVELVVVVAAEAHWAIRVHSSKTHNMASPGGLLTVPALCSSSVASMLGYYVSNKP